MSAIRRQSIISSVIVYAGFALGIINTWLFTRQGSGFTEAQYGLTGTFIAIASVLYTLASLGMPNVINKFFPYYRNLPQRQNDGLSWALLFPALAFVVVTAAGVLLKDVLIDKIFDNSPQLLRYYYLLFPFGLGYLLFAILEAWAWQHREGIVSNLLKEVGFRAVTTLLILLLLLGVLRSFDSFMIGYASAYLVITAALILFFIKWRQFPLHFKPSAVTHRFRKKIRALGAFVWGGTFIYNMAAVADTIIITAVLPDGLSVAGIFTFGQLLTSLIQAPQRAVVSAAVGPLSQAWKEKDMETISKIYQRSSLNLLLFSAAAYTLILLNFKDAVETFNLKPAYLQAFPVFIFMGLTRVVDLGTGVNAQIISTSTLWRFEFITGLVLFTLLLPLNYQLTRYLGVVGPAIANLIAYAIYNAIRCIYLWQRFRMQPFGKESLFALALAGGCGLLAYFIMKERTGMLALILRSALFLIPFLLVLIKARLSPDAAPVWKVIQKRIGISVKV